MYSFSAAWLLDSQTEQKTRKSSRVTRTSLNPKIMALPEKSACGFGVKGCQRNNPVNIYARFHLPGGCTVTCLNAQTCKVKWCLQLLEGLRVKQAHLKSHLGPATSRKNMRCELLQLMDEYCNRGHFMCATTRLQRKDDWDPLRGEKRWVEVAQHQMIHSCDASQPVWCCTSRRRTGEQLLHGSKLKEISTRFYGNVPSMPFV